MSLCESLLVTESFVKSFIGVIKSCTGYFITVYLELSHCLVPDAMP